MLFVDVDSKQILYIISFSKRKFHLIAEEREREREKETVCKTTKI
jgi:hypothetical protein